MTELLQPHVMIPLAVIACASALTAMTFIIVLRDKISGVRVSRTGVEIHTNDVSVWSKIVDTIEQIDTETCKSLRKATAGLMIIDPDKYNCSAEAMLVIREADQPLIYAAYENHHTRALAADADAYLADKTQDVLAAMRMWKKHFAELIDEKMETFVCYWFKKVLLPSLRRACHEKADFYKLQLTRTDRSQTIEDILAGCLKKNLEYIACIDALLARQDINEKSSVFYPEQKRGAV